MKKHDKCQCFNLRSKNIKIIHISDQTLKNVPLPDKIEKKEKVDPQGVYKMPENGTQGKAQVVIGRIAARCVPIKDPDQRYDPGKNMQ